MAAHSRFLAWRIPGTEEPVGLPSMGSHRVRHDRCDLAAAAAENTKGGRTENLNLKYRLRNTGFHISEMKKSFVPRKHSYMLYFSQLSKAQRCLFGGHEQSSHVIWSQQLGDKRGEGLY